MKSLNVPATAQQVSCVGMSKDYLSAGIVKDAVGFIRVKNIGGTMGHVRIQGKYDSEEDVGMAFSVGETEYLYINEGETLEIVDGKFNIMF